MHTAILPYAIDEFQKSRKMLYFKECLTSTVIKIPSVWRLLKSSRPVCYHMHLNLLKPALKTIILSKI